MQRTWIWANSWRKWRARETGMLQSVGSQRIRHDLATEQQQEEDVYFTSFPQNNSKWITGLNVKWKTIKLLEDDRGEKLDDIEYGDDYLDTVPEAQSIKGRIDKLDFMKMKTFYYEKDNIKNEKTSNRLKRKYLQTHLIKSLIQNTERTVKTQQ